MTSSEWDSRALPSAGDEGEPSSLTVEIGLARDGDAGEVMTVQRAAYVSEAQLYDNPHLSALSESLDDVRKAIAETRSRIGSTIPRM